MLSKLRARLSFANVVSVIALFVALGGTSIAAVTLARNSVKSRNIAPNAVTGPKVKNASLLAQDFAPGQIPQGQKGDTGAKGDTGDKGTTGDKGNKGDTGDTGDTGGPGTPGTPGTPGSPAASMLMGQVSNTAIPANASGAAATFVAPSGPTELSGNTTTRAQVSPNATIVVRDLAVIQTNTSGASGQLRYRLQDLNTPSPNVLLECSISGATAKSCNSGSQSATVLPGTKLVIEIALIGTTNSTFAGWGWRATTP